MSVTSKSIRKTLTGLVGAAALALASVPAVAGHIPAFDFNALNFTIDPTAIGEAACTNCTAKYIDFSYGAEVDQTQTGALSASFTETGGGFFGTFRTELTDPPLAGTGLGTDYQLYFLFSAVGTTAPNGTGLDGTITAFTFTMYVDRSMDTTLTTAQLGGLGGDESIAVAAGGGDDIAVLTGTLISGGFHIFPGLAAGDFDVVTDATALNGFFSGDAFAPDGSATVDVNGVNTRIQGIPTPNPFATTTDILITGSGNLSATAVPEPGTVMLLGLGIAGLAVARRKAKV